MGHLLTRRQARLALPWALLVVGLLWSPRAWAQEGGLLLQIDTEYERTADPGAVAGLRDVQMAGLSIDANGRMGNGRVAHSAYLDAHFGAGLQGGFAYRFALLPLGFAIHDRNQFLILNVAGGIRLQGVTAHQDFGVQAPLRVSLIARIGDHLLLNVWGTHDVALNSERKSNGSGGAENAFFGDEMRAGLTLRVGGSGKKGGHRQSVTYGSGYFVGALYSERFGTEFWGLTIGHGMNMRGASGRRSRSVPVQRGR